LLKHIWFHKNAMRIDQSLSGVRRSYALRAWSDLAQKYPPAHAAMVRIRNAAESSVWKDKNPWQAAHDLSSLNEYLNNEPRTAALFISLNRKAPRRAERIYSLAEPLLIQMHEYKLCGRYLDPAYRFSTIRRGYRVNLRLSKDPTIVSDLVHSPSAVSQKIQLPSSLSSS
jgi:hypothetical protein